MGLWPVDCRTTLGTFEETMGGDWLLLGNTWIHVPSKPTGSRNQLWSSEGCTMLHRCWRVVIVIAPRPGPELGISSDDAMHHLMYNQGMSSKNKVLGGSNTVRHLYKRER